MNIFTHITEREREKLKKVYETRVTLTNFHFLFVITIVIYHSCTDSLLNKNYKTENEVQRRPHMNYKQTITFNLLNNQPYISKM